MPECTISSIFFFFFSSSLSLPLPPLLLKLWASTVSTSTPQRCSVSLLKRASSVTATRCARYRYRSHCCLSSPPLIVEWNLSGWKTEKKRISVQKQICFFGSHKDILMWNVSTHQVHITHKIIQIFFPLLTVLLI